MNLRLSTILTALLPALAGCASVVSTKNTKLDSGLIYFMPKRDILITVTNTGGKLAQVTATPSEPYADRSTPYLLEYQRHPLAKNALDVTVGSAGLLTNAESNQTGDAVSAITPLGSIAGFVRGFGFGIQSAGATDETAPKLQSACKADGTHTFLISLPTANPNGTLCGIITYDIRPLGWDRQVVESGRAAEPYGPPGMSRQPDGQSLAGVFYRVNLPYRVKLEMPGDFSSETIVFSPSESREYFLPIARTFFANNDAKITLAHGAGVPSQYVQNTEGEVAALLKLPAAFIGAYFAAVGQVLSGLSTKDTTETTTRESAVKAQLGRLKYEACLKAIEAKDTTMIANLGCGGSSD